MDNTIKILFLEANPEDTERLRLDKEVRNIDQALRQAQYRDKFDIEQKRAVRISDLQEHFLRYEPHIVHFRGHGSPISEIILEDDLGHSQTVPRLALSRLFSLFNDSIRCVVLNACYSHAQASAIAEHIDCVIGMSKAIRDESAIGFATAFYRAIGYGKDINTAFELGCLQIDLESLNEQDIPQLLATKINPKEIVFAQYEPQTTLIRTVLEVVKDLQKSIPDLEKVDQNRRNQIADYFDSISKTLEETFLQIEKGENPWKLCAEIEEHARVFEEKLDQGILNINVHELAQKLKDAHHARRLLVEFADLPDSKQELRKLGEASGKFYALAKYLRSGI